MDKFAKTMNLSEVPDEWLRAWVDAGYMSQRDFEEEMERRKRADNVVPLRPGFTAK